MLKTHGAKGRTIRKLIGGGGGGGAGGAGEVPKKIRAREDLI